MMAFCQFIHFGRFPLIFLREKIQNGVPVCVFYMGSIRRNPSVMYLASMPPSAPTRTAGFQPALSAPARFCFPSFKFPVSNF
jgi:hypothetical protein